MYTVGTTDTITKNIRRFIAAEFLLNNNTDNLRDSDLLFEGGIIDSAGAITLITYLEQCYDIKINDEEIFPSNFATIEHIVRFIKQKQQVDQGQVIRE